MKKVVNFVIAINLAVILLVAASISAPKDAFAQPVGKQSTIYVCTGMNSGSTQTTYTRMVCYDIGPYNPCIEWSCTLTWNNSGY